MDIKSQITAAAIAIKNGELVIMPTETVYGLAGDALNPDAIAKIFKAKQRPSTQPLIAHIASNEWCKDISPEYNLIEKYSEAFWPGPLTLVVKKCEQIPLELTGQRDSVAIRFPNHQIALSLIESVGSPVAAPSANVFTRTSPTSISHISPEIRSSVSMILDGGQCAMGIESTVLDLTQNPPKILRLGPISGGSLSKVAGLDIEFAHKNLDKSPGNHPVHYSPRSQLIITDCIPEGTIGIGIFQSGNQIIQLPNDPTEYARLLYSVFHQLDALEQPVIYLERPPSNPDWETIWDRIRRASTKN